VTAYEWVLLLGAVGGPSCWAMAAWRMERNRDDAIRRRLDLLEQQFGREMRVMVASVGELTARANRNTEALEHSVTATAALTTRTERVERASHHHAEMDSLRGQKP
jgi:hypothetical protein